MLKYKNKKLKEEKKHKAEVADNGRGQKLVILDLWNVAVQQILDHKVKM